MRVVKSKDGNTVRYGTPQFLLKGMQYTGTVRLFCNVTGTVRFKNCTEVRYAGTVRFKVRGTQYAKSKRTVPYCHP